MTKNFDQNAGWLGFGKTLIWRPADPSLMTQLWDFQGADGDAGLLYYYHVCLQQQTALIQNFKIISPWFFHIVSSKSAAKSFALGGANEAAVAVRRLILKISTELEATVKQRVASWGFRGFLDSD